MHAMHARLPKNFVLEERLERYADAIEVAPEHYAGRWAEACLPLGSAPYREVRLDMGCGKGGFTAEMALRNPDVLYVGIDSEPICIAYAAQKAIEGLRDSAGSPREGLPSGRIPNMVLVPALGTAVSRIFGAGELAGIYLNFPTPFPKKRDAVMRLTHLDQLMLYRTVLAPGASVLLKTDSYPLWRFSLTQFELAGYTTTWVSEDARGERPNDAVSWYEERLGAQGATVYAIEATPGPTPTHVEQTAELSLAQYLPDDLTNLSYVPHGMQGTVTNLRNLRLKQKARQL